MRALLAQTYPLEQIVVVDSASPDDTAERLRETFGDRITVLELADNLGPGAAIAAAFEHLERADLSDVWLVEDDSRPAADCLAQLVAIADTVPTPAMVGPDGANLRRGQWRLAAPASGRARPRRSTSCTSTAPCSAPRSCASSTVPARDYFVMMVDVEYPLRLRAAGVTMLQAGVPYESLRLGATAGGSPWRAYYQTRNHLHLAVSHRSPALLGGFVLRTAKQTAYAIGTGSWDQLAYRWRGVADAIRGRMGRTVEPPPAAADAQPDNGRTKRLDAARAHVFGRLRRRVAVPSSPRVAGTSGWCSTATARAAGWLASRPRRCPS